MVVNRNIFTYLATIFVLALALVLFITVDNSVEQFRILALVSVGLGSLTTIFYTLIVKEGPLSRQAIEREANYKKALGQVETKPEKGAKAKGKSPGDWMKEAQFYLFGCVYMFARISFNTTATIMPLYLTVVSKYEAPEGKETPLAVAAVPLCAYICQLIFSVTLQNWMTQYFRNRLIPMIFAIFVTTAGSLPMAFLGDGDTRWLIYIAACI